MFGVTKDVSLVQFRAGKKKLFGDKVTIKQNVGTARCDTISSEAAGGKRKGDHQFFRPPSSLYFSLMAHWG